MTNALIVHSRAHAGLAPAGQAAGRHRGRADDRARVAPRRAMPQAGLVVVATDAARDRRRHPRGRRRGVMTRPDHASGSDRVFEAVNRVDPRRRGRLRRQPAGRPADARAAPRARLPRAAAAPKGPDIATLAAEIVEPEERTNPNVVKVVGTPLAAPAGCAPSTSRAPPRPHGDGPLYHHIGIYAYRRSALERFVALRPSPLEKREKLEQLRALEDGMRIDVALVDTVPLGVDTPGRSRARPPPSSGREPARAPSADDRLACT